MEVTFQVMSVKVHRVLKILGQASWAKRSFQWDSCHRNFLCE